MKHMHWLKLTNDFVNFKNCPNCNNKSIAFQFVGGKIKRIGQLFLWCNVCLYGIHVSRTQIPEGIDMLPMETSITELEKVIPKYKFVH